MTMKADGWPFPGEQRPFTYALNNKIPSEVGRQQKALAKHQITVVHEGLEVEFCLCKNYYDHPKFEDARHYVREFTRMRDGNSNKNLAGLWQKEIDKHQPVLDTYSEEKNTLWAREKAKKLEELRNELEQAPPEKHSALNKKIQMLKNKVTNAREMVMYELLDEMPDALDVPDDFYDGPNVLEVQFKKTKLPSAGDSQQADKLNENRKRFFDKLHEKVKHYGLQFMEPTSIHYSLSFEDAEGKNILEPHHPLFSTHGKAIAEGMTAIAADGFPYMEPPVLSHDGQRESYAYNVEKQIRMSLARGDSLRLTGGRLEYRSVQEHAFQHFEMMRLMLLAGATYGLDHATDTASNLQRADMVERLFVTSYEDSPLEVTAHVLNGSSVSRIPEDSSAEREVYQLNIPEGYVRQNDRKIQCELGMIDGDTYTRMTNLLGEAGNAAPLLAAFNKIRIVKTQNNYYFAAEGKEYRVGARDPESIFDQSLPADDTDTAEILTDAQGTAERIAHAASALHIVPGFHLMEGYDLNPLNARGEDTTANRQKNQRASLKRAADSIMLKERLSPDFHRDLVTATYGVAKSGRNDWGDNDWRERVEPDSAAISRVGRRTTHKPRTDWTTST